MFTRYILALCVTIIVGGCVPHDFSDPVLSSSDVRKSNERAFDLYQNLRHRKGNIIFSPSAIFSAGDVATFSLFDEPWAGPTFSKENILPASKGSYWHVDSQNYIGRFKLSMVDAKAGFRVIEIPYRDVSLTFVVPEYEASLSAVEEEFTLSSVEAWRRKQEWTPEFMVMMPLIDVSARSTINGVKHVAEFRINADRLGDFLFDWKDHWVSVFSFGCCEYGDAFALDEVEDFDGPFLFFVSDNDSGMIRFMGRIVSMKGSRP